MPAERMSTDGDIDNPSGEANTSGMSSEDEDTMKRPMKPWNASASEHERSKRTAEDNSPGRAREELNTRQAKQTHQIRVNERMGINRRIKGAMSVRRWGHKQVCGGKRCLGAWTNPQ